MCVMLDVCTICLIFYFNTAKLNVRTETLLIGPNDDRGSESWANMVIRASKGNNYIFLSQNLRQEIIKVRCFVLSENSRKEMIKVSKTFRE
jgi:hypothetical protein